LFALFLSIRAQERADVGWIGDVVWLEYSSFANSEYGMTKPQDVVVALKLCCLSGEGKSFALLAAELGMSASEVHGSFRRLTEARLLDPDTRKIRYKALREFLRYGVPYVFPAQLRETTRGIPTAWAAPVMAGKVAVNDNEVPVWPEPEGSRKGLAVEPLYSSVPVAAKNDSALYDLLALVDVLRIGRARERAIAEKEIEKRLNHDPAAVGKRSASNV
jgi:hypothetical protein